VTPVARRILAALADHLEDANFEHLGGGLVTLQIRLDETACPKRILVKTEQERHVERRVTRRAV
jgi:hypothetical protein